MKGRAGRPLGIWVGSQQVPRYRRGTWHGDSYRVLSAASGWGAACGKAEMSAGDKAQTQSVRPLFPDLRASTCPEGENRFSLSSCPYSPAHSHRHPLVLNPQSGHELGLHGSSSVHTAQSQEGAHVGKVGRVSSVNTTFRLPKGPPQQAAKASGATLEGKGVRATLRRFLLVGGRDGCHNS